MEETGSKVGKDLMQALEKFPDTEEMDVLVYPKRTGEDFKEYLAAKKMEGLLDYNILQLANCIAIKGRKAVILEIAGRPDVSRIVPNPRFTAH